MHSSTQISKQSPTKLDSKHVTNTIQWFILSWKRTLLQASTLLPKRQFFYQLLPVLCAECIRWSVNGLWAVHGFACLRLRLVKVCCVSVVFKVALVRSQVHLKCDRGMQDVPFFFPLSRIDTMHQYISALYDYYLLYLDWYATNLELLVISIFFILQKGFTRRDFTDMTI